MNLIKKSAMSAVVAAAVTLGAGTAHADPVLPAPGTPAFEIPGRHDVDKQQALENMLNELGVGWANGGAAGTAIGALIGLGVGCVSMFPGSLAGCIIGTPIGAITGAIVGIGQGNPKAQQAIQEYINTP
ncbi:MULTISPECIES: hypothetical protein [unclassified Rhodococcus (in: high G+C Gram-positive bacteria)]|uniref:hypothetical protein n=1 Tax=unclassified Rhodococcus (in: high G+C Gram-positive bacteria) TaxID=192944 RepID=UPI00163A9B8C|nr:MULTISPECIES: hypothetical protein [unclassified Rhodococcus (in: high G+C Gram-positive bacteria)]MBC2638057.1 hypothetical protein [Rhodococcus sp. 3A]MBC2897196.1 hypothetical protein [Rhodococcus sp. 4CII]